MQKSIRIVWVIVFAVIMLSSAVFVEPALIAQASPPNTTVTTSLKSFVAELMKFTTNMTDTDGDTLPDSVETIIGTDFNNTDSDFDRLSDSYEIELDIDPMNADSNNDGLPDYYEVTNVSSLDVDGDNVTNAWDFDNDGDNVNDAVDLSPFAKSITRNNFHFNIQTNGSPTYITFQVRPEQSEYLKLLNQYWNWVKDDKGSMKDLDNSIDDVHIIPMLNLTANVVPNQSAIIDYGIVTTSNHAYVPLYAVTEYGTTVAFTGKMIYPQDAPMSLSIDAELIWRVIGETDEKAVALRARSGYYVSISADGKAIANATAIDDEQRLAVVDMGENRVAYNAPNGLYLTVANNGFIYANATEIGDRETFTSSDNGGGKTALKAYNGKYLTIAKDGTLVANSTATMWSWKYLRIISTADFTIANAGVISTSITLATYKAPFMLTGLALEENYGSQVGLFFSHDKNETMAANILMSYDFLRNATTQLSEMPDILANYDSQVFNQINFFSHKDEAFMLLTNEEMPNVLNLMRAGAGSQIAPIITGIEDHFASLDLSQITPNSYIAGASINANLTAEPVVTSKTLKMNLYNTTTSKELEIDDVMAEVQRWESNENASIPLMSMMTAWNIGEQFITKIGTVETTFDFFKEYLGIFAQVKDIGSSAFNLIRKTLLRGYEAYRLIAAAHKIWMASGGHIGGKSFISMFKVWKATFKDIGKCKTGRLLAFKRISQTLEVIGVLIDVGIAIYSVFSILDSGLDALGLTQALLLTVMTLVYSLTLTLISAIPVVGWLISLIIAISDLIGKWSAKLFNAIISAMTKVSATVTPAIAFVGDPTLTIVDKDSNGLDVGDRIEYQARIRATLTSSDSFCLSASELYPYYTIANPTGTNSTVGYPYLTEWVFVAKDLGQSGSQDIHLWLPIPPWAMRTYTSGTGWRAVEYPVGGWIEPGTAMPNFPMTLQSHTEYELWYKYKIFWFFVFYWFWEEYKGRNAGIMDLGSEILYFDVLPGNLADFVNWKSITPPDRDHDGLKDTEEKATNPLLWDTDGDGLNDKYELDIGTNSTLFDTDKDGLNDKLELMHGTNATNADTDGDGLSDYTEIKGWIIIFTYGGNLFTFHVASDPLNPDTDGDGLKDDLESSSRLNPKSKDTDGDGTIDQERIPPPLPDTIIDTDGDGINDSIEKTGWNINVHNMTGNFTIKVTSDHYSNDTDSDGLTDLQEYDMQTNPKIPDTDGDGVNDLLEKQLGTNSTSWDTDEDGLGDGTELTLGSNPKTNDTDGDGLLDLDEILHGSNPTHNDTDSDGLDDLQEVLFGSNITNPDSDDDLLFDGQEFILGTNPTKNDTDSDGLLDGFEPIFGTNPLNNDTDSDFALDGIEIKMRLIPTANDTDWDGLLDGIELQLGTNPLNPDTDFDRMLDAEDPDSYVPNVKQIVLAFDNNTDPTEFINNLSPYTNITVVSPEELLANYTNAQYIVLLGKPGTENGTVGNITYDLLKDQGETLTNMMQSNEHRFAIRYGIWSSTQTVLMLSQPYSSDHYTMLNLLKSKNVTILPNSVTVDYQRLATSTSLNYSIYFSVDEIDMVRAIDASVAVTLEESVKPSIQINRYNATTTPYSLTKSSGLAQNETAIGKYLEINVSQNVQNKTNDIIAGALVQIYYTESDLDRTGDGDANDQEDLIEATLCLYFFNETSSQWTKLSTDLSWVIDTGVNTTDFELYGKKYAGYVWAYVSRLSLFGIAGRTYNNPPDVSNAHPSIEYLWPPNHEFVNVTIEGVTDPDGDPITIRILNVTSDEPTDSTHPDAYGIGTDTAHLSAERLGNGDGRVYVITFLASDGKGGETMGSVKVYVSHDQGHYTWHCVEDG